VFLSDFKYLKQSNPLLGLIFAMLVFSMSGIPPLGGFFVKLDVLSALLENSRFYLNYIYFFFTVASFFYYLRLIKIIYFDKTNDLIKQEFISEERLTIISIFFLFLIFYMLLIQKPFIILQIAFLSSLL
jgi:NADH-quinone oxidoreductase subunit N